MTVQLIGSIACVVLGVVGLRLIAVGIIRWLDERARIGRRLGL